MRLCEVSAGFYEPYVRDYLRFLIRDKLVMRDKANNEDRKHEIVRLRRLSKLRVGFVKWNIAACPHPDGRASI